MSKQDLIRKLTSRKFWAAIAQFVTMLIAAFGAKEETAVRVSALIMAGAAVVAYIVGEGLADAAGAGHPVTVLPVPMFGEDEEEDDADDGKAAEDGKPGAGNLEGSPAADLASGKTCIDQTPGAEPPVVPAVQLRA